MRKNFLETPLPERLPWWLKLQAGLSGIAFGTLVKFGIDSLRFQSLSAAGEYNNIPIGVGALSQVTAMIIYIGGILFSKSPIDTKN